MKNTGEQPEKDGQANRIAATVKTGNQAKKRK